MASIIRIKRSGTNGNPSTLGAGELAYSALSGTQSNGGDRLYIGMGTETAGNAVNHVVIGGKYFTDMLDHAAGTLTASSALVVDSNSKIDLINVGNLTLTGSSNTISSTDTNGNILLDPNGTGYVQIVGTNGAVIPVGTTAQRGPAVQGTVRYNTDTSSFEGYSGATWGSLGGVKSVDGLTYIAAENSPGSSDDTLHFYASNNSASVQVVTLDTTKLAVLQTTASSSSTTGALTVAGGAGIAGDLYIGGGLNVTGAVAYTGGATFNSNLTLVGSDTAATEYFKVKNGSSVDKFVVDSATGNTTIAGTLGVTGATTLAGVSATSVTNSALTSGRVTYAGSGGLLQDSANLTFNGTTLTANTLAVTANGTVGGTFGVTGATTLSSTLGVTGATTLSSTLSVTGDVAVNTNKFNVTAASGNTAIAGTLGAAGDFAINTNKFTVASATGNTSVAGTFGATGAATLSSTLGVTGAATLSSTLAVTGISTFTGAVTANGGVTAAGAVTITAGGTNTNVNLVPNGTGTVDVGNKRITSVAEPTQSTDAATKNYVDAVKTGLDPKDSVRIATTAALTATYSNGSSGVGATLTNAGTQAAFTVDSIVGIIGDRVLVKNQATALQNGIYTITTVGTVSTNWVLTRSTDADQNPEVTPGAFTFVEEGTTNGQNGYVCTNTGAITIGTTGITWVQFSGAGQVIAGNGLTKSGNTLDVVGTSNRITVSADAVDIAATYVGQTSITTLGTVTSGTWNATTLAANYGGTGVANAAGSTITLGGALSISGAFTTALTVTGNTTVTLPTTGTLATLAGTEALSNKTITASSFSGTTVAASGLATFTNTTDAGPLGTAGVVMSGGLSVAKQIYVGTNITGAGASTSTIDGFNIDGGTY
jgi:hypothetical protein